MKPLAAAAALVSLCLPAFAQEEGDGAFAQCVRFGDTAEVCACASEGLAAELSAADLALYSDIGLAAVAAMEAGARMVDAYDAAVAEAAAARGMGRTAAMSASNAVGSAHRDAIATCRG
ncbi:hypothetical protein P6F26_06895 [Roseibacterium sp. SDUM158017]|uniref:hypothetical protein n=1 Tax=Roseicyclus salinarum TaxID=3036773 RepID=UPI00241542F2|nr:hypothetical protein [Roseibacterium sp. SDUM158017]MDG4648165.1 hypothetical protein [Roseibacterium sp. SDUM158017]